MRISFCILQEKVRGTHEAPDERGSRRSLIMRRLNVFGIPEKGFCPALMLQGIQEARYVRAPFSDSDILELQDLFLSNGVHYIKVDDVQSGRLLIKLFLKSLNFYHNVACLSTSSEPLDSSVLDLYGELMVGGYFDEGAVAQLEEFFLEHFDHDFLWLEASEHALESAWMNDVFKQVKNFKLEQLLPILVVSYQEKSN